MTIQFRCLCLLSAIAVSPSPLLAESSERLLVVVAPEPIEYRMEYSLHTVASILGAWGPLLANKARNKSMSSNLTTSMMRANVRPNQELRDETIKELGNLGIASSLVQVPINPTDQSGANYRQAAINGPALHVYYERIGVQSRSSNSTYTPFAHVFYCYIPKGKSDCQDTSDRGYYGEGYTEREPLVVPADMRFQWSDSDDVMRRQGDVIAAFGHISSEMGSEIAKAVFELMKQ